VGRNSNKHRKEKRKKWLKRAKKIAASTQRVSPIQNARSVAAPKLRSEIDKAIQRLLEIGRQFDPLPIISQVAVTLQFRDPDERLNNWKQSSLQDIDPKF
jgi:hypothetical protein